MRHDLSPARFFRKALSAPIPQREPRMPAPRGHQAPVGEWAHLRAWMRLSPARAGTG